MSGSHKWVSPSTVLRRSPSLPPPQRPLKGGGASHPDEFKEREAAIDIISNFDETEMSNRQNPSWMKSGLRGENNLGVTADHCEELHTARDRGGFRACAFLSILAKKITSN
jgi:hypothetical protein